MKNEAYASRIDVQVVKTFSRVGQISARRWHFAGALSKVCCGIFSSVEGNLVFTKNGTEAAVELQEIYVIINLRF